MKIKTEIVNRLINFDIRFANFFASNTFAETFHVSGEMMS